MIDGSTLNVLDLLRIATLLAGLRALLRLNQVNRLLLNSMLIQTSLCSRVIFPVSPFCPGVIIMEALAQAASCCLLIEEGQAGRIGYLAGIDKAKFRAQVKPGDTIRLEAKMIKKSSRMCIAEVRALKGGKVCAQAVQKYIMGSSA